MTTVAIVCLGVYALVSTALGIIVGWQLRKHSVTGEDNCVVKTDPD